MMSQYSVLANDLRFYSDQRFKTAGAFLVANGLFANVALNDGPWGLALLAIALSILCLWWERYANLHWWALTDTVVDIERRGIQDGTLMEAYGKYTHLETATTRRIPIPPLRASQVIEVLYFLAIIAWLSWLCWVFGVLASIGLALKCRNLLYQLINKTRR